MAPNIRCGMPRWPGLPGRGSAGPARARGRRFSERGGGGGGRRGGGRGFRRRGCYFCETKEPIDYKNPHLLRRFIADTGRIDARRKSMVCAKHQRSLARAIKRARYLGLLPFVIRRRLRA